MKIEKHPYGIYRFHQYKGKPGFWERISSYRNMDDAKQALKDLTQRRKEERIYIYAILPVQDRERWFYTNNHEQLKKIAK